MRIELMPSAHRHAITADEIRCVIEYPILIAAVRSRAAGQAVLYVGRFDDNEPLIEVIGKHDDDDTLRVFHAMFLTAGTVRLAGIENHIDPNDLTHTQRQ